MSIVRFELKADHIKLLKNLKWSLSENKFLISREDDDDLAPFGMNNLYEGMALILDGMPKDFDPLNTSELETYPPEKQAEWNKLFSELPMAVEIIFFNNHFETGWYQCVFHERIWKKQTQ